MGEGGGLSMMPWYDVLNRSKRTWGYDANHLMVSEIDARGFTEQSFYDTFGRATQSLRKDGSIIKVTPVQVQGLYPTAQTTNPFAAPTVVSLSPAQVAAPTAYYTDARGNVLTMGINQSGHEVSGVDALGSLGQIDRSRGLIRP
jgi:YD repeat-containing protein